jgi:hypothetical protein
LKNRIRLIKSTPGPNPIKFFLFYTYVGICKILLQIFVNFLTNQLKTNVIEAYFSLVYKFYSKSGLKIIAKKLVLKKIVETRRKQ